MRVQSMFRKRCSSVQGFESTLTQMQDFDRSEGSDRRGSGSKDLPPAELVHEEIVVLAEHLHLAAEHHEDPCCKLSFAADGFVRAELLQLELLSKPSSIQFAQASEHLAFGQQSQRAALPMESMHRAGQPGELGLQSGDSSTIQGQQCDVSDGLYRRRPGRTR